MAEQNTGKITQVIGAVLDIRFDQGVLPEINDAVEIRRKDGSKLVAETAQHLGDTYTGTGAAPHADTEMELSHRESEILKRLCENRNQVVNTQNVLLDLWGDDSFFNSRSLHVFITKLRHKLAQDDRIRIVNVRGIGYKLIV